MVLLHGLEQHISCWAEVNHIFNWAYVHFKSWCQCQFVCWVIWLFSINIQFRIFQCSKLNWKRSGGYVNIVIFSWQFHLQWKFVHCCIIQNRSIPEILSDSQRNEYLFTIVWMRNGFDGRKILSEPSEQIRTMLGVFFFVHVMQSGHMRLWTDHVHI